MKSKLILEILKNEYHINDAQKPFSLSYSTSEKFKDDKIHFENDDYYLILDGVILNKKELL